MVRTALQVDEVVWYAEGTNVAVHVHAAAEPGETANQAALDAMRAALTA